MGKKNKPVSAEKIRFSIGAKLKLIISLIVIISLGSITALASWLIHNDLRLSAEDNNKEINRRSVMEAEVLISNVRSNSRVLIQSITALGTQNTAITQLTDLFYAENPQIASVFYITSGRQERSIVNRTFFSAQQINENLSSSYVNNQRETLSRAVRGETVILNATPYFSRPLLALFFSLQNGGVAAVLFSSQSLIENFGFGTNQSFLLSINGDVLVPSDLSLIQNRANISNMEHIRYILDNAGHNGRQQLFNAEPLFPKSSEINNTNTDFLTSTLNKTISYIGNFLNGISWLRNLSGVNSTDGSSTDGSSTDGSQNKTRQFTAFTRLNTTGAIVITSIEYDKVFEGIAATTRRNIYLTIAVLCISVIFIHFFAKTISIPLKSLASAAKEIEGGKFDIKLESKRGDEIAILTSGFQKMCLALNVFGRFTNKEIAVRAMRGEIKPGGLSRNATIFFSDIREFTAKSEGFTKFFGIDASDKIVHWLNQYFTQMVECVEKTNGVVDKFIGDAVMAHWGTAYSAGSPRLDAFNCVKAALMMRKALFFMNKERRTSDPSNPSIHIGCGINSGMVTAGQLGSDIRMEYTVIGDPVNVTSRIESLTKPLGADILISEDTWKLVGDKFITEEMPSVTVKGKSKPLRIFAVINFAGESKGPQNLEEVRSLLGIETPNLEKTDINSEEKKYKIG